MARGRYSIARRWRRSVGRAVIAGLAGVLSWSAVGCGPPYGDVLVDEEGEQIRLEGVLRIVGDNTLSDEEKRDGLINMGITDDELLDALIRA